MTEREIPDGLGFLFGGMTDSSLPQSAPSDSSAPENPAVGPAPAGAPLYASRREARAAGILSMDAAAAPTAPPVPQAPAAPAYEGIASLFPLLGDVPSGPVTSDLGATQAIPAVEVAAELATPVARYVVPQSAPVAIVPSNVPSTVPSWHVDAAAPAPAAGAPAVGAAVVGAAAAAAADDPFLVTRRTHAAPARPTTRPASRGRGSTRTNSGRADSRGAVAPRAGRPASTRGRVASGSAGADAKSLRQRLFGVGVMVLVGGLFAVLAIPAYADNDAATLHAAAAVQAQKLTVADAAASKMAVASRDGYTATSAADLRSLYAAALREQNIAAYLQSGAKAKGDDYPWFAELSRNQGGGLSPLGYYYRECVDFVAWRLNRDAGTTSAPFRWTWSQLTPNGGDARQWKSAWLAHGWPTGTTPVPGAVAWFSANHVAYVNGILQDGQVLIEEYNYGTQHQYGTRVINASDAYYLYAPPK